MSSSVILNEEIDENYEPDEDELLEYAKFLGMEFPEDDEFLYIAREGLKAPLPEPWKPCQTKGGDIYFFNFDTGESVWEHPCDTYYKELFTEAKNKKKSSVKKPPLQESKDRSKKNINVAPKSISPVGFEKKRDLLSEIIQLEKELKENKTALREKYENELESQFRDLSLQRDIEIKLFKEQLEKENKKKSGQILKDIENVEEIERKNFEVQIQDKIKDIKRENDKLIEEENKKLQEKVGKDLETFEKEQDLKMQKNLEIEKISLENEKKIFYRELDENKELFERQKKNNARFEEELKSDALKEESKIRKNNEKLLEEFKRDQEYEIQKAMVSARNKKSQQTLQEKIKELKEEYKVKEAVEKRNLKREFEDEVKELYRDVNFNFPNFDTEMFEYEKNKQFEELNSKFKLKQREEMMKIDQEYEKKINVKKEILDRDYRDKVNMFKEKQPKANYTDLEQKLVELSKESLQTKEKIKFTEENIAKYEKIIYDLKKQQDRLKVKYENEQDLLPNSEKIKELRQKLQEKDQELEKIKSYNPNKLEVLENEIREIKSLLDPSLQDKPIFHYEEKIERSSSKTLFEKNAEKKRKSLKEYREKKDEEFKENIESDEEFLGDWRKDESWNISRDISPVGVDSRQNAYRKPQYPTRTWIKPREETGRFSTGKKIGQYLY